MKKKISSNKLFSFTIVICIILSFIQVVILPTFYIIFIKLLLMPIPKNEFENIFTKICSKNIIKEANKESLASLICNKKSIFLK